MKVFVLRLGLEVLVAREEEEEEETEVEEIAKVIFFLLNLLHAAIKYCD